jgi:hypothetical protein
MVITKPHTLNRPLAELRQLREQPELIEQIPTEELRRIALYAITREDRDRPHVCPPESNHRDVVQNA